MIWRSILFLTISGLITLTATACAGGDDPATPGFRVPGTIQGNVIDVSAADGPLAEVTVRITSIPFATDNTATGEIVIITSTDAFGNFYREDIPNGEITVKCSKAGYLTPSNQNWALSPGGGGIFHFEMAPGEDPIPEFVGDEQSARPPHWEDEPEDDY